MSNSYNDTKQIIYRCDKCDACDCKLWRYYQAFLNEQELFCLECALKKQKKKIKVLTPDGKMEFEDDKFPYLSDQIGWLIPAVPTEENDTFWGYTSVPQSLVIWWKELPNYANRK